MTNGRVDPSVIQELDRLEARGRPDPRALVIIELVEPARVSGEGSPRRQLARLEEQVHELQQRLLERLHDLGVTDPPRQMVLANGIAAELTRGQVMAISTHPDVRRIHLAREERVTT